MNEEVLILLCLVLGGIFALGLFRKLLHVFIVGAVVVDCWGYQANIQTYSPTGGTIHMRANGDQWSDIGIASGFGSSTIGTSPGDYPLAAEFYDDAGNYYSHTFTYSGEWYPAFGSGLYLDFSAGNEGATNKQYWVTVRYENTFSGYAKGAAFRSADQVMFDQSRWLATGESQTKTLGPFEAPFGYFIQWQFNSDTNNWYYNGQGGSPSSWSTNNNGSPVNTFRSGVGPDPLQGTNSIPDLPGNYPGSGTNGPWALETTLKQSQSALYKLHNYYYTRFDEALGKTAGGVETLTNQMGDQKLILQAIRDTNNFYLPKFDAFNRGISNYVVGIWTNTLKSNITDSPSTFADNLKSSGGSDTNSWNSWANQIDEARTNWGYSFTTNDPIGATWTFNMWGTAFDANPWHIPGVPAGSAWLRAITETICWGWYAYWFIPYLIAGCQRLWQIPAQTSASTVPGLASAIAVACAIIVIAIIGSFLGFGINYFNTHYGYGMGLMQFLGLPFLVGSGNVYYQVAWVALAVIPLDIVVSFWMLKYGTMLVVGAVEFGLSAIIKVLVA